MAAIPSNLGVPTGTIMWSAAPEVPVGWLLCDGRLVTVGDQPALAAYIGTIYGGDGINTIGLPDLVGRFAMSFGDSGRDNFTYQDGINKEHVHGMFANQTHTHGVTDPGHEHPTSSGSHSHDTSSNHTHTNTSDHFHRTGYGGEGSSYKFGFVTHGYTSASNSAAESYAPIPSQYSRDPATDFFRTVKFSFDAPNYTNSQGKTGITMVNSNVTGTTVEIAFTGVTLATQVTGITLQQAQTGMTVDRFGVVGGPRPQNIALLPIIRT
jgi:microcystin-dependent protein